MTKEYDVMESIEMNMSEIQRKISKEKLEYLIEWTRPELNDYNIVRDLLLEERKELTQMFEDKLTEYNDKYGVKS